MSAPSQWDCHCLASDENDTPLGITASGRGVSRQRAIPAPAGNDGVGLADRSVTALARAGVHGPRRRLVSIIGEDDVVERDRCLRRSGGRLLRCLGRLLRRFVGLGAWRRLHTLRRRLGLRCFLLDRRLGLRYGGLLVDDSDCDSIEYCDDYREVPARLLDKVQSGDTVLIMGAGSIEETASEVVRRLRKKIQPAEVSS